MGFKLGFAGAPRRGPTERPRPARPSAAQRPFLPQIRRDSLEEAGRALEDIAAAPRLIASQGVAQAELRITVG